MLRSTGIRRKWFLRAGVWEMCALDLLTLKSIASIDGFVKFYISESNCGTAASLYDVHNHTGYVRNFAIRDCQQSHQLSPPCVSLDTGM